MRGCIGAKYAALSIGLDLSVRRDPLVLPGRLRGEAEAGPADGEHEEAGVP